MFIYAIIGTTTLGGACLICFEILPSLLNGASMTLQVFALVLIFSIPLGIVVAFVLQVRWKPLHYLIDLLYLGDARDSFALAINLYLLCSS